MTEKNILDCYIKNRPVFEFVLKCQYYDKLVTNNWNLAFLETITDIFTDAKISVIEVYDFEIYKNLKFSDLVERLKSNQKISYYQCFCDLPCFFQFENGKIKKTTFAHNNIFDAPVKFTFKEDEILFEIYPLIYSNQLLSLYSSEKNYDFKKAATKNRKILRELLEKLSITLDTKIVEFSSNYYDKFSEKGIEEDAKFV